MNLDGTDVEERKASEVKVNDQLYIPSRVETDTQVYEVALVSNYGAILSFMLVPLRFNLDDTVMRGRVTTRRFHLDEMVLVLKPKE